ncbi:TlpA disulfide reductase family protein [Fulvivirgaceae bacterium BMA12]|uniref:TlpA disulfide reductase family protein n=1 Tax=Agaribacillus aureus TaxID=3051825 RepID=A0ABT8L8S7_9BACT|nr:TlpA disulfide reductase family protein [Fulvivirgaceae bacterium BMA12]
MNNILKIIAKIDLRPHVLLVLLLLMSLNSFSTINKEVTIDITVNGAENDRLVYAVPVAGITYLGFSKKARLDPSGQFQVRLEIDHSGFVEINNSRKVGYIFVQPGNHYQFTMDHHKKDSFITIKGRNEAGQNFYNQLKHISPKYIGSLADDYVKDTIASILQAKIMKKKEAELATLNELYRNNLIDLPFFEIVSSDITCFFNLLLVEIIRRQFRPAKHPSKSFGKAQSVSKQMGSLWMETFKQYPVVSAEIFKTRWWYEYADHYIQFYTEYADHGKIDIEKLIGLFKKGEIHSYYLKRAEKHLSGSYLEYYSARYIHNAAYQKDYEKELINLFEKWKARFPKSQFYLYVEPLIQPIKKYHKLIEQDYSKEVKFLETGESINSLGDALKSFKGKAVYVDIWATTCGPCKKEFENNDGLIALLKSHDVAMFYLSVDKDRNAQKWKDMIKYYNLEGIHLRATRVLIEDLKEKVYENGSMVIPRHLIIDRNGNLVEKSAARPSDLESLKRQLEKI